MNVRDDGIKSKNIKENVTAIEIEDLSEIDEFLKKNTRTIFIDEANFLKGDVSVLTSLSIDKNIDIYILYINIAAIDKLYDRIKELEDTIKELKK
jgi:thymidine kinase